jgi:hypothetical protein
MVVMSDASQVDGLEFYKASEVKIKFNKVPKKAWCVDGEKLELRNISYTIKNANDVEILVPSKNLNKLLSK